MMYDCISLSHFNFSISQTTWEHEWLPQTVLIISPGIIIWDIAVWLQNLAASNYIVRYNQLGTTPTYFKQTIISDNDRNQLTAQISHPENYIKTKSHRSSRHHASGDNQLLVADIDQFDKQIILEWLNLLCRCSW